MWLQIWVMSCGKHNCTPDWSIGELIPKSANSLAYGSLWCLSSVDWKVISFIWCLNCKLCRCLFTFPRILDQYYILHCRQTWSLRTVSMAAYFTDLLSAIIAGLTKKSVCLFLCLPACLVKNTKVISHAQEFSINASHHWQIIPTWTLWSIHSLRLKAQ